MVRQIKSYESSKLGNGCFGGHPLGSRIPSPNLISIHLKIYHGTSIFSRMFTSSRKMFSQTIQVSQYCVLTHVFCVDVVFHKLRNDIFYLLKGSVHTSPSGSIKETSPELVIEKAPSSTGSIRESHSRSKSPQSQKSNGSKKSPSAAGTVTLVKSSSPPRHSRSRSRSTSRRRYRSR